jgi:hypothetical protein
MALKQAAVVARHRYLAADFERKDASGRKLTTRGIWACDLSSNTYSKTK